MTGRLTQTGGFLQIIRCSRWLSTPGTVCSRQLVFRRGSLSDGRQVWKDAAVTDHWQQPQLSMSINDGVRRAFQWSRWAAERGVFAKAPGVFMSAGSELGEEVLLPACVSYIKGENLPQKRVTSLCNSGMFKLKVWHRPLHQGPWKAQINNLLLSVHGWNVNTNEARLN